jgi:hypothetical protein
MALRSRLPTAVLDPGHRVCALLGAGAVADVRRLLGALEGDAAAAELGVFANWVERVDALARARTGAGLAELGLGELVWDGYALGESVAEFLAGALVDAHE